MHPSCLGIMQVAFLGGFDDIKLPSCRCDVNGSMTVSKTVRLGSNPSTDAIYNKDNMCMNDVTGIDLEHEYRLAAEIPSDFVVHVPMLRALASVCDHVTEMGVRTGVSTRALLAENCILRSYDIDINDYVEHLFQRARALGKDVQYIKGNTLGIDIEPTDMLFIDTEHTYQQLSQELRLHAHKVRKFLAFHDTDKPFGGELLPAIMEFLASNKDWAVRTHNIHCHGFTVLERVQ